MLNYKNKSDKNKCGQSVNSRNGNTKDSKQKSLQLVSNASSHPTSSPDTKLAPGEKQDRLEDAANADSRRSQSHSRSLSRSSSSSLHQDEETDGRSLLRQSNHSITFVSLEGSIAEDVILKAQGRHQPHRHRAKEPKQPQASQASGPNADMERGNANLSASLAEGEPMLASNVTGSTDGILCKQLTSLLPLTSSEWPTR